MDTGTGPAGQAVGGFNALRHPTAEELAERDRSLVRHRALELALKWNEDASHMRAQDVVETAAIFESYLLGEQRTSRPDPN